MMYETTDAQHLRLKDGRYVSASLKLLIYYTIANSSLLQISISGMPVVRHVATWEALVGLATPNKALRPPKLKYETQ